MDNPRNLMGEVALKCLVRLTRFHGMGVTAREVHEVIAPMTERVFGKRYSELEEDGFVYESGKRADRFGGSTCKTWCPTAKGLQWYDTVIGDPEPEDL